MNLHDLTPEQRHQIITGAARKRDYFGKLRDRMKATGWAENDPVYVAVAKAYEAAHQVVVVVFDGAKVEQQTGLPDVPAWKRAMGGE